MSVETAPIRELFVEELAEVHGGSVLCRDDIKLVQLACDTTQACCEEGPDNCCP